MNSSYIGGATQCETIRARLLRNPGEWVSVLELHQLSGSLAVHSRINDLRQSGLTIDHRNTRHGRKVHSEYRIP